MNLQSTMKQILEKTELANDDLMNCTNNTRPMREANKRAAVESLKDLKNEYRKMVLQTAVYLVVTGSQAEELGELAKNESKCFSSDAESLYKKVLSKVDVRAYENKQFVPAILDTISNHLEDVALECGIQSYPMLRFTPKYSKTITKQEELLEIIKDAINVSVGGEMVGIYTVSQVLEDAIKRGHAEAFVPVILTATDENLAVTLSKDLKRLSPNTFLVTAGKAPKATKGLANVVHIKEASKEALEQLLKDLKGKVS